MHILFTQKSLNEHVSCFYSWLSWIMLLWSCMYKFFFETILSILLAKYFEVWLLNQMITLFNFLRSLHSPLFYGSVFFHLKRNMIPLFLLSMSFDKPDLWLLIAFLRGSIIHEKTLAPRREVASYSNKKLKWKVLINVNSVSFHFIYHSDLSFWKMLFWGQWLIEVILSEMHSSTSPK